MRVRAKTVTLSALAMLVAFLASGCGQYALLQARKAWKDANQLYRAQDYQQASAKYEEVIASVPDGLPDELKAAYFFLGNSYDNMYRPARRGEADNDALLTKAVANYKLAAETITEPQMRQLSLQYLVAAYGADKLNDPAQAEPVLLKMIEMEPKEPTNYFVLGKLYEDVGSYDQAEAMYLKAREVRPNDSAVYMQLARFYNDQGNFEKTMEALHQRATMEPSNPEAHYFIANYYWDKVFRDFRLRDEDKREYIAKGLDAVDKAIALNNEYIEAITYRGLLLRLEANLERNRPRQEALIKEAEALQAKAKELQQKKIAGVSD